MRFSSRISNYLTRDLLFRIGIVFFVIGCLIFLFTFIELLRRTSRLEDITTFEIMIVSFLQIPVYFMRVAPFVVLIASLWSVIHLTRTFELVVMRSSGVSAWRLLRGYSIAGGFLGFVMIFGLTPISAYCLKEYTYWEAEKLENEMSVLSLSGSGLWLRQSSGSLSANIHANRSVDGGSVLHDVSIWQFKGKNQFEQRFEADKATLVSGQAWRLENVTLYHLDGTQNHQDSFNFPTTLTVKQIGNTFSAPETFSFFGLMDFIHTMTEAGFNPVRHQLQLQTWMALPFSLISMVAIALGFSPKWGRQNNLFLGVLSVVITGFFTYFISTVTLSFGQGGILPLFLAVWSPWLLSFLASCALLFHREDG